MRIKKMLAILTAAMMAVAVAGCSASTQGGSDTGKEAGKENGKDTGKEDAGAASEADGKEAEQAKDSNPAGDAGGLQGKSISLMTPYLGSVTTNQMVEYIEQKLKDAGAEVSVIQHKQRFFPAGQQAGGCGFSGNRRDCAGKRGSGAAFQPASGRICIGNPGVWM